MGAEAHNDIRHDVGHHDIIADAHLLQQGGVGEHIAPADGVAVLSNAVQGGVLIGHVHALLIDVAGEGALRAQAQGGDGQDAAAAAQVQHPLAAVDVGIQRLQAQAGGGVAAGAERQSGI